MVTKLALSVKNAVAYMRMRAYDAYMKSGLRSSINILLVFSQAKRKQSPVYDLTRATTKYAGGLVLAQLHAEDA
eukprot:6184056-Pleurochrysis_carterae.AAC.1